MNSRESSEVMQETKRFSQKIGWRVATTARTPVHCQQCRCHALFSDRRSVPSEAPMKQTSTRVFNCLMTVALLVPAVSQANNTIFELVNRSAESIFTVNISPTEASGWGPDLLGKEVIMPGSKKIFNPGAANGCMFDVRVVYKSEREEERRSVNLCETEQLAFNGSGATNASRPSGGGSAAPSQAAFYDGTQPLRCGSTVNCRSQAETVQRMQTRWVAFSRSTHFGSTCLEAIGRMRSMHPAAYGDGNPGWVQPQLDVCNLR